MPCTPGGSTTPLLGLCKPAEGETGWANAINGNWDIIDTLSSTTGLPRSYLAGCGLTRSSSTLTRVTVAAGQCRDANNTNDMTLTTNITKDLGGSWVAGNNQNGLFSGTATQNTWYHVFLIGDVSVTPNIIDAGFDTSVSAANKPAAYSAHRRLGSVRTATNNTNIIGFVQTGDFFQWETTTVDVAVTNPGATDIARTLTVPIDVQVLARFNALVGGGSSSAELYVHTPGLGAGTPSTSAAPLMSLQHSASAPGFDAAIMEILTNTSAQIRTFLDNGDANSVLRICTLGWWDRRGRDD